MAFGQNEVLILVGVAIILAALVYSFFIKEPDQYLNASAAKAHNLAIASFAYSLDHGGTYPNAGTSTAIFQQLYDGKYLAWPGDVFLTMNGSKTMLQTEARVQLSPMNVSYDYTTRSATGLTKDDPQDLPLLFSCVVIGPDYKPGENEVTLDSNSPWGKNGVTMVTLGQDARFKRPEAQGTVYLTPPTFKPAAGVTYQTRAP